MSSQQTNRHKIHGILLNMVVEMDENQRRVTKGKDNIEEQAENNGEALSRTIVAIQALIATEQRRLIERIEEALPPKEVVYINNLTVRQVLEKVKGEISLTTTK